MSKFSTEVIDGKVEVQKMDHVYGNAEEKWVKNVVLYGKSGDNYLYSDEEGATGATEAKRIDATTLMNMLKKGVLVSYGGAFYAPVIFKDNSGVVEVTIVTAVGASSSTSVVLYSKEHTAG